MSDALMFTERPERCPICDAVNVNQSYSGNFASSEYECGYKLNRYHPKEKWQQAGDFDVCENAMASAVCLLTERDALKRDLATARAAAEAAQAWPAFIQQYMAWAFETFPSGTAQTASVHLKREAAELADTLEPEETADCLMLLLFIAHRLGIDLLAEAQRKFAINQTRQWSTPDAEGVAEHVRAPQRAGQPSGGEAT